MAEKEYIERKTLLDETEEVIRDYLGKDTFPTTFAASVLAEFRQNIIKQQPAADVVEVKRGRWKEHRWWQKKNGKSQGYKIKYCSLCGCRTKPKYEYRYCPNCGAKMDGDQK